MGETPRCVSHAGVTHIILIIIIIIIIISSSSSSIIIIIIIIISISIIIIIVIIIIIRRHLCSRQLMKANIQTYILVAWTAPFMLAAPSGGHMCPSAA